MIAKLKNLYDIKISLKTSYWAMVNFVVLMVFGLGIYSDSTLFTSEEFSVVLAMGSEHIWGIAAIVASFIGLYAFYSRRILFYLLSVNSAILVSTLWFTGLLLGKMQHWEVPALVTLAPWISFILANVIASTLPTQVKPKEE